MEQKNSERWITIEEAARRLGLSERDVETLAGVNGVITIRPTARGQLLAAFEVDALAPAVSEMQVGESLRNLRLLDSMIEEAGREKQRILDEINAANAELERQHAETMRFIDDRGGVETWLTVSRHVLSMYRGIRRLNGAADENVDTEMSALVKMLGVMSCKEVAAKMNLDIAAFQRLSGKILSSMSDGSIRLAYENVARLENKVRKLEADFAELRGSASGEEA